MRKYRAYVQVITPDSKYWNPLAAVRDTELEAQADVEAYLYNKRHSLGGFRQGAPGRTKILPIGGKED